MDVYVPVKGKCTWWREIPNEEDRHDISLRANKKRVECVCVVEGRTWQHIAKDVPSDCPDGRSCRYYVKHA